jgi:hypothetical protein
MVGIVLIWRRRLPIPLGVKNGKARFLRFEENRVAWYLVIATVAVSISLLAAMDLLLQSRQP